jgi:hypothetical protein
MPPDLRSLGRLCADLQASIPRIRKALEQLGIEPSLTLNGVDHYDSSVVDELFPLLHPTAPAEAKAN